MPDQILCDVVASMSELKANPMKVVATSDGRPILVLNRNEPAFYCVPARTYEAMMEILEDAGVLRIVRERSQEPSVAVTLDEL